MGLYDDEEIVGAEAALAEKQRLLELRLAALLSKVPALEALVISPSAPAPRSPGLALLVEEAEGAAARFSPLSPENVAGLAQLRSALARGLAAEEAGNTGRPAAELELLREQLGLRLGEIEAGASLQSVARAHLGTLAARLRTLASEHGLAAAAPLAAEAEAASGACGAGPAASPRDGGPQAPAWAEVEAALTLWLHRSWHEALFRVEPLTPGLAAQVAGIRLYDTEVAAFAVAPLGARRYRLTLGLALRDGGWHVERVGVL